MEIYEVKLVLYKNGAEEKSSGHVIEHDDEKPWENDVNLPEMFYENALLGLSNFDGCMLVKPSCLAKLVSRAEKAGVDMSDIELLRKV